jgi:hypothetical protein
VTDSDHYHCPPHPSLPNLYGHPSRLSLQELAWPCVSEIYVAAIEGERETGIDQVSRTKSSICLVCGPTTPRSTHQRNDPPLLPAQDTATTFVNAIDPGAVLLSSHRIQYWPAAKTMASPTLAKVPPGRWFAADLMRLSYIPPSVKAIRPGLDTYNAKLVA